MDILIVTPRRDFWEILKSPFEERGAAVRMAGDIEEALASLHEARAALAVLDLFGGEVLGRNVTEVSFPMKGFETRVLITGDADEMLSAFTAVP